jgi:phenylacetate 2-hydroxylase
MTAYLHPLGQKPFNRPVPNASWKPANFGSKQFCNDKELWVGHSNDLIDRPFQHEFADKLQLDLSGAAMTEPINRCRKAAMRALGKPSWPGYYPLVEPSSVDLASNIFRQGDNGEIHLEIYPYLRQIVFDLALSLTYKARQKDANHEFVLTLVKNINKISSVIQSHL